jgi:peptidoglycan/xylan/chitin deacetylase (PgdA/CDA1 family)
MSYDPLLRLGLRLLSPPGAAGRLSIVIFHRVFETTDAIFPGDPDRRRFDELCGWLAAWFRVLPLDEAVQRLATGSLAERALCITFDDGYADNHDIALPILQAHGLTATFFIASGYLDGGRMWNDTIVESVKACRADSVDLTSLGVPGLARCPLTSSTERQQLVHRLLGAAKYLLQPQRQALADRVAQLAGVEPPGNLMMSSQQVRAMASAGMQIGAHTVSHPILARLDDAASRREIEQGRAELQAITGAPVTLFAYPNGKPGTDYLPRDADIVRQLGFEAAVSTSPGAACLGGASPYELPRFTPWDSGRLRFGLRMAANLRTAQPARR